MKNIQAVFVGGDGSVGYDKFTKYELKTYTAPSQYFEDKRQVICFERMDGSGYVEYEHFDTGVINNWRDITQVGPGHIPPREDYDKCTSTKHNSVCLQRAKDDEPIFVLRAQDVTSPAVIVKWVELNLSSQPWEKLHGAVNIAKEMQEWRDK